MGDKSGKAEKPARKGRRSHLNDYKLHIGENGKSEYIYEGKKYVLGIGAEENKRFRLQFSGLALADVLFYLVGGLSAAEVSRATYVALPFAITFLPMFFSILSVYYIASGRMWYTEKRYGTTVLRLAFAAGCAAAFGAACVAGAVAFMILTTDADVLDQALFVTSCICVSITSLFLYKLAKKYSSLFSAN